MTETIGRATLHHGDCLAVLPTLEADSIDSCVTDPPYHLTSIVKRFGAEGAAPAKGNDAYMRSSKGFMGKAWDGGDVAFRPETWAEVLRVLKPGAHLLAFGGTRGYHRLACAIEDAGFEIRDAIMWHYGQGFAKSHNISKGIDKAAGAKREQQPGPFAARKPNGSKGNVSVGMGDYRGDVSFPVTGAAREWNGFGTALKPSTEIICVARKPLSEKTIVANVLKYGAGGINIDGCRIEAALGDEPLTWETPRGGIWKTDTQAQAQALGRWPANLCHDGSPEVLAGFPDSAGAAGDVKGTEPSAGWFGRYGRTASGPLRGDEGSAARFFKECQFSEDEKRFWYGSKADAGDRLSSRHPTIKPIDLMRWLVRLVTPPRGTVLDCFAGSGTTGMAALAEGFSPILIEREEDYCKDIRRRLLHVSGGDTDLFAQIDSLTA